MIVTVRLHANLRRPSSDSTVDQMTLELNDGATLTSLLELLEIRIDPEALLMLVNRRRADPEQTLRDQDDIRLFPAISGGC